jgi:S1-C subfamily serine protease
VNIPEALAADSGDQTTGLLIISVEPNTPGAGAGLLVGDILIGLEGVAIRDADDLQRALGPERVGASVRLQLIRGGARHELSVTLGVRD